MPAPTAQEAVPTAATLEPETLAYASRMGSSANDKRLLGEAGEHLVISRLQSLGYVASQAPRGWQADDVFVREGPTFQVKTTNKGVKAGWVVGKIDAHENRWYALVDFRDISTKGAKPFYEATVYVVPSLVARDAAGANLVAYHLARPNTSSEMCKLYDPWKKDVHPEGFPSGWLEPFRENWEQLPEPTPPLADSTRTDGGEARRAERLTTL
jgi:hypothetical protein